VRKYLSAAFERARLLGKIKYNPVRATDGEKSEPATRGTFSPEQVARLVQATRGMKDGHDWAGAVLFAYGCGGRLQDVANLRWNNLDCENAIVTFRQRKTGAVAIVGLHPDFLDWIARSPPCDDPNAFLFPALAGCNGAGRHGLSRAFEQLMERAGIKSALIRERLPGKKASRSLRALSFHAFRHTVATEIFNQAALKEITRRVTAHAAGGVVDRYIHQDIAAIREATKLIPRLPL